MIPICMVTGFLGSGKTTFLQEMGRRYGKRRNLVFLINELSKVDVDGARIKGAGGVEYSVLGGSIFCACRVTEFIRVLRDLPSDAREKLGPIDGLIVETSGISNPEGAARLLHETGLNKDYQLVRIICVVAPKNLLKLMEVLPNLECQLKAADTIILNKCDTVSTMELDELETELVRINPSAELIRATYTKVDLDPFEHRGLSPDLTGGIHGRNPFTALDFLVRNPVSSEQMESVMASLGASLLRVKGCIPTVEGGMCAVDFSDGQWTWVPQEKAAGKTEGRLVIIVPDGASEATQDLVQSLLHHPPER